MHSAHPKVLFAGLSALILSACASAPPDLNDNMIIPGERIGEIELGMPLATLLAVKGQPVTTTPIKDTEATTYTYDGIIVAADDEVYWIIANHPAYRTSTGIAPGVGQMTARSTLGKPKCVVTKETTTAYDYGNLYFEVDNVSGKVVQVGVLKNTPTCRVNEVGKPWR